MATKGVALTERHGGDLVAEVLKAHNIEFIFCLSGGHISPFLVSSQRLGIRVVDVRHEVNAVFAADAVGRLSGSPGVAAVTAGPGVTNTVTAVQNAKMAQSPLVLLGGAAATLMQGRGALQDIDHMAIMGPICKQTYSCRTVRDVVPMLRAAFREARGGVPGPVFVELPLDVLYSVLEMLPEAGTHERLRAKDVVGDAAKLARAVVPREALQRGLSAQQYVESKPGDAPVMVEVPAARQPGLAARTAHALLRSRLHAGAHDVAYDFSPLPFAVPQPRPADVAKVAELLRGATRPLFVLQSQCMLHGPSGADALARRLEALGAPCFLGGMSRGLLGRNSPVQVRQQRGVAIKKADVVVLLGVSVDFRLGYGRSFPSGTPVVYVNRSDQLLNSDLFWSPAVAALADPALFVAALAEALGGSGRPEWAAWTTELKAADEAKEAANAAMARQPALGRNDKAGTALVNPLKMCFELDAGLHDDTILVTDGGDIVSTASYIVAPRGPLTWLDPGAYGTLVSLFVVLVCLDFESRVTSRVLLRT